MLDLESYSEKIWKNDDGIYSTHEKPVLSYPEEGNEMLVGLEESSYWFRHRNKVIINKVLEYNNERILFDIGGGNGFVSKGLTGAGVDCVLVEPGADGIRNAKGRGLNYLIHASLGEAEFHNDSLPGVGLFDVLEHIEDDIGFLKEIGKLLSQDGYLYLTVPAYQSLWSSEDEFAQHYRRYDMEVLLRTAEKAGFRAKYATYLFSFLPLPIYLLRSIPTKLGLRKPQDSNKYASKEHVSETGLMSSFVDRILTWEFNRIQGGKSMPIGSSCFVVLAMA